MKLTKLSYILNQQWIYVLENVTGGGYLKKPEWGIGGWNEWNFGNDGMWGIKVGMGGIGEEIIFQISLGKMKLKVKHLKPIKEKL